MVEEQVASVLLKNNRTCTHLPGGWIVEDAGQRTLCGGVWKDRVEARRRGEEIAPDLFGTLNDAIAAALEK